MVVHSGVFALCYDPVCFEKLEDLDEMLELDVFPLGSSFIAVLHVEALSLEVGLFSNDGESPTKHMIEVS